MAGRYVVDAPKERDAPRLLRFIGACITIVLEFQQLCVNYFGFCCRFSVTMYEARFACMCVGYDFSSAHFYGRMCTQSGRRSNSMRGASHSKFVNWFSISYFSSAKHQQWGEMHATKNNWHGHEDTARTSMPMTTTMATLFARWHSSAERKT